MNNKESVTNQAGGCPNDLALAQTPRENERDSANNQAAQSSETEKEAAVASSAFVLPLDTLTFWSGLRKGLLRIRSMKWLNLLTKKGFLLDQVGRYVVKTDNKGSWRHEFNFWLRIPLLWRIVSA